MPPLAIKVIESFLNPIRIPVVSPLISDNPLGWISTKLTPFSNFGSSCVDLIAPGSKFWGAVVLDPVQVILMNIIMVIILALL